MTIDTKKLREVAEAASPGPWRVQPYGHWKTNVDCYAVHSSIMQLAECGTSLSDAAFIAAANPQTVIALLDELARIRPVYEAAVEWKRVADDPGAPVWKYTEKLDAAIDNAITTAEGKP